LNSVLASWISSKMRWMIPLQNLLFKCRLLKLSATPTQMFSVDNNSTKPSTCKAWKFQHTFFVFFHPLIAKTIIIKKELPFSRHFIRSWKKRIWSEFFAQTHSFSYIIILFDVKSIPLLDTTSRPEQEHIPIVQILEEKCLEESLDFQSCRRHTQRSGNSSIGNSYQNLAPPFEWEAITDLFLFRSVCNKKENLHKLVLQSFTSFQAHLGCSVSSK
jgi:hypothetical protein